MENGVRTGCKGCRLDKCLLAEMDPALVNIYETQAKSQINSSGHEEFLQKMADRKKRLLIWIEKQRQQQTHDTPNDDDLLVELDQIDVQPMELLPYNNNSSNSSQITILDSTMPSLHEQDWLTLNWLLYLEGKHQRLWDSLSHPNPNGYLDGFATMEELLASPYNILDWAEQFEGQPRHSWNKQLYIERCEQFGNFCKDNLDLVMVDRLLMIEMAKALPFFRQLDTNDQVVLLRHIAVPFDIFVNAFYSAAIGAETWTRSNGLTFITSYLVKRFQCNERIVILAKRKLNGSVRAIKECAMGKEEFVLLLVIFFCSTTATELSESAKTLLYNESVRYSQILLRLLQSKHGSAAGAAKYAQCMHALGKMFSLEYVMHMLVTNIALTDLQQQQPQRMEYKYATPRALSPLFPCSSLQ